MWRHYESDAIEIGLDLNYFWQLTPKQFTKHLEGNAKRTIEQRKETDMLNHILGQYIRIAFNQPNQYPDDPQFAKPERKVMTDDEMERRARNNTILLGGKIKK